jgi:hypothetical protein
MGSHVTHQVSQSEDVSTSEKFAMNTGMSPRLEVLLKIAKKYYEPAEAAAAKSDDDQEVFTSAGAHMAAGCRLTAMMALRAAANASEKSA